MNRRSGVGTTRARLLPAAVGLLAGGLLLLLSAVPAEALAQPTLTLNKVASPATTPSVTITGSAGFTADGGYSGYITSLAVTATFEGQTVGSCQDPGSNGCGPTSGFSLSLSQLAYNGPYSVAASDASVETLLGTGLGAQTATNSASTSFEVAVKPAAPRDVTTTVNSDGTVTVAWDRNTEPDLIGYLVTGGSVGSTGAFVKQPSGSTVSWTDPGTTAGGPFDYIVTAYRNGPDGKDTDPLATSSGAVTASVPVPAPVTTVGGATTSVAGTTTTVVLPQADLPNLSSFLAQAAKAGALSNKPVVVPAHLAAPAPAPARVQVPSGPPNTYDPTLPFGKVSSKVGANGAPQVALPASSSSGHGQQLLISVAGGMLLCVCGLALRNSNRRNGPTTLEPLNAGDGDGSGGGGAQANPAVIPASAAAKAAARAAAMTRRPPSPGPDAVAPYTAPLAVPDAPPPPYAPGAAGWRVVGPVPPPPYAPGAAGWRGPQPVVGPAPTYQDVAAADPFPAPAPAAAAGSKPDVVAGAEPESAPDRGALAFSAAAARAGRDFGTTLGLSPSVHEAVDYFRLLKPPPPEDEP